MRKQVEIFECPFSLFFLFFHSDKIMFRNRYISFNKQRNYIRQRYVFNASSQFSTKERYTEVDGEYYLILKLICISSILIY